MIRPKPALLAMLLLGVAALLAACAPAATPTPSECVDVDGGQLVNTSCDRPGVEPDPTATPLPGGIDGGNGGSLGEGATIFSRVAGCGACHANEAAGTTGQVGPDLSHIGSELSAADIRESILDPAAVIAADCPTGPCAAGVMPATFADVLSAEQLDDLVEFLSGLQ